jgi:hypothetical protein
MACLAAVIAAVAIFSKGVSDMMRVKTFEFGAVLACGALALASLSAAADDNKDSKDKLTLAGVWMQTEGEVKIEFADKDVMKIFPHGDKDVIIIVCSYTVGKDGLVKVKITELEGTQKEKVKELLPIGLEFSFKWQVKDGIATIDDVKGDKLPPAVKTHLEGKYEQKK